MQLHSEAGAETVFLVPLWFLRLVTAVAFLYVLPSTGALGNQAPQERSLEDPLLRMYWLQREWTWNEHCVLESDTRRSLLLSVG